MAYTKLDGGITESTIWQAPDATRLVWITMLARADQNGYIGASMPGLAGLARVSLEACIEAIKTLEAPDQWSRTKEHDGRRIAPADGGWVLLNHAKYRAMQSADDRRERSRIAMANLRHKRKQAATVNQSYPSDGKLTQAEAEAEATTTLARKRAEDVGKAPPGFETFWTLYPRKTAKTKAAQAYARLRPDDSLQALMLAAVSAQLLTEQWLRDGGQFIPHPASWINGRRWEDEGSSAPASDIFAGAL